MVLILLTYINFGELAIRALYSAGDSKELVKTEPAADKPIEEMTNIEYARMTTLLKSELDYQSGMVGARREGLTEQIQAVTGLPIETIERM